MQDWDKKDALMKTIDYYTRKIDKMERERPVIFMMTCRIGDLDYSSTVDNYKKMLIEAKEELGKIHV